jgi:hypothetical protein
MPRTLVPGSGTSVARLPMCKLCHVPTRAAALPGKALGLQQRHIHEQTVEEGVDQAASLLQGLVLMPHPDAITIHHPAADPASDQQQADGDQR